MDGLDSMQGIVVIGATNRLNEIDPALRRTGRFNREIYFPLPNRSSRLEILQVHTRSWVQQPSFEFLNYLAEITSGYCGSDLEALCSDAVMSSLTRTYPNIHSRIKIFVNSKSLEINEEDFLKAHKDLTPAKKYRIFQFRLSEHIRPLMNRQMESLAKKLYEMWPHFSDSEFRYVVIKT